MASPRRRTIVRTTKTERYVVVQNSVFEDDRLSWEARGLMGYILCKPDHWQVRLHDLLRKGPAGQHKIRRMLRELRDTGYLVTRRIKRRNGTFEWVTLIFENPFSGGGGERPQRPDLPARP